MAITMVPQDKVHAHTYLQVAITIQYYVASPGCRNIQVLNYKKIHYA